MMKTEIALTVEMVFIHSKCFIDNTNTFIVFLIVRRKLDIKWASEHI